jgi:hypothetical protein
VEVYDGGVQSILPVPPKHEAAHPQISVAHCPKPAQKHSTLKNISQCILTPSILLFFYGTAASVYYNIDGTLFKKERNFPHIIGNLEGIGAKWYMTNGHPIYDKLFAHFLIYV